MSSVRRSGFSLVELIVVVAVVGLLTKVAYPRFAQVKRTYDLVEAAQVVAGDLRLAREEARRRNVAMIFASSGTSGYTLTRSGATAPLWSRTLRNRATMTMTPTAVRFPAFGPITTNATPAVPTDAVLLVQLGTFSRRVTLTTRGQVRVQ